MESKNIDRKTVYDESLFEWDTPEYIHHEKGTWWKVFVGGAWAALTLNAFLADSWTFAVALLIFGGVYVLLYHEKPRHVPVKISRLGFKLGGTNIPFSNIRAFWMHYDPPFMNQLHIRTADRLRSDYVISMEDQHPAEIREYLVTQIPEWEGKRENLSEITIRLLRL
jgi:hypothetical protein